MTDWNELVGEKAQAYVAKCNWRKFIYEDKSKLTLEEQVKRPSNIPDNIYVAFIAGANFAREEIKHARVADGILMSMLTDQCEAMAEALEFYASSKAYTVPAIQPKDMSECSYSNIIRITVLSVTQKAREALAAYKKFKEGGGST